MPSTYNIDNYPIVSDGFWAKSNASQPLKQKPAIRFYDWLQNPRKTLVNWTIEKQRKKLHEIAPLAQDATVTQIIANVPELLLAPVEFEFSPNIRKPHQHYLGLCMRPHRQDTEIDPVFETQWPYIMAQKEGGNRLIYCSFGTYHEGADASLLRFMTNILAVMKQMTDVVLVCAANKYVIQTLQAQKLTTANTHFFTRVPQMKVLTNTDVFITHAGFGSIKEAIYYGVPMLAYPLDPRYDQNGNALKIEYHGLGLRGVFNFERTGDMQTKIVRLLEDDTFKKKVKAFKVQTDSHYTENYFNSTLNPLLK